jgi:hypothetical protein
MAYDREIGTVGEYTFYEVTKHGFTGYKDVPLYKYSIGKRMSIECFETLDEAMVAAVGAKYTGERGAGGSGVDTAAGWFMRMIGARQAD